MGSTPGSGRFPGGGNDNPCLENHMDRGEWKELDTTEHACTTKVIPIVPSPFLGDTDNDF